MKTIRLYGELGEKYGRVHKYAVRSPAEAIRALGTNKKGFIKDLTDAEAKGVGFRVFNGNFELQKEEQVREPASGDIVIMPALIGANAEARILIGAVLIAVAYIAAPYTGGASLGILQAVGGIGFSLVLGGVAQMISPPPKADDIPERPENKPSYAFNGPVNTTAQGHPVPVGYGRLIVGGAVISASITLDQLKTGFKRVKSEASKLYHIQSFNSQVYGLTSPNPPPLPANWFARVKVANVAPGIESYTYYYYVWTLVPI